jgi:hypothetical protein
MSRTRPRAAALALIAGVVAIAALATPAAAAPIAWAKRGAFEACLEKAVDKWLREQAELQVNESPDAARLDDPAVASWTLAAIAQCRGSGEAADTGSVDHFGRYMAQWRQHIYDLAADIRKKGQPD